MGRYVHIIRHDPELAELNLSNFEQFISNSLSTDDSDKDYMLLTLHPGSIARICPGLAFEILKFDKKVNEPGYLRPQGKGCCDIYSRESTIQIKVYKHTDNNSSFGFYSGPEKTAKYGPFHISKKLPSDLTVICYFSQHVNCGDVSNVPYEIPFTNQAGYVNHTLMISRPSGNTIFIINEEEDICDQFTTTKPWEDIYSNKFSFTNDNYSFKTDYINSSEIIDINNFLPPDAKITKFICRKKLSAYQEGTEIELTNGSTVQLEHLAPRHDLMFFLVANVNYIFIPKNCHGKLVKVHIPNELLTTSKLILIGKQNEIISTSSLSHFSRDNPEQNDPSMNLFNKTEPGIYPTLSNW